MTNEVDMSTTEELGGVTMVRVWIVAPDANGAPAITHWAVGVTEAEQEHGYHYEMACKLAVEAGYGEPMVAFDEKDPAGKQMLSLLGMQSIAEQEVVPGNEEEPEWGVTITVDSTLSARVRVRADSEAKAIEVARTFVSSDGGRALLSLDDGNYRGARDFYCGDPDGVERLETAETV